MTAAPPMKVFISYSRRDRDFVANVVDALEAADGIEVFRDTDDILPTEEWQGRLEQLIREADTIVFALSPHSAKSEVCRWEVELAESLNKRFAPIVIRDVEGEDIPAALAKLNYIFFTNKREFDASIGNLVAALNTDIGWIREHTRLGNLARRWDLRGRPAINTLRGSDLTAAESWISSQPRNAPQPTLLHHEFIQASRKAATKRQRMTVGGSLAAASIAIALAGYAFVQQRAAESALRTGTESANKLVFGLADRFRIPRCPAASSNPFWTKHAAFRMNCRRISPTIRNSSAARHGLLFNSATFTRIWMTSQKPRPSIANHSTLPARLPRTNRMRPSGNAISR
ncbi:MAG: toll/interleukin-1 receptor domain-containing protein [Tepidamorphaceae bacterium]